jgi:hypothetical protein
MLPKRKLRERTKAAQKQVVDEDNTLSIPSKLRKLDVSVKKITAFPFLRLPREIRDLIYHEIWQNKLPFTIISQDSEFMVEYEICSTQGYQVTIPGLKARSKQSKYPAPWILTNKQILVEAVEQFQHKSSW